jgi:long-chain acyl-CoA synthetase
VQDVAGRDELVHEVDVALVQDLLEPAADESGVGLRVDEAILSEDGPRALRIAAMGPDGAGTGSNTIAGLMPAAAAAYGDGIALRQKSGDDWVDVSYDELGRTVGEIALGLVDLGIEPGDRVAVMGDTSAEWTHASMGALSAAATGVSVYPTYSPEECHHLLEHSESRAVFVQDAEQLEKVSKVRSRLPKLDSVIVMRSDEAGGEAIALDELRDRGRGRDDSELERRIARVAPEDVCMCVYTSGTTATPKGCLLTHANCRAITDSVEAQGVLQAGETVFLFLPLAHPFALTVQFVAIDLGATIAYWEGDLRKIVGNLVETKPSYFPSIPPIFEKVHSLVTTNAPDRAELEQAVRTGVEVRRLQARGEAVPGDLAERFEAAEEQLYKNVRGLFGGSVRRCITGAAPIATEILEFFYACGIPVMEGYGTTEAATGATVNRPDDFRFGSVGKPIPGMEMRVAEDGEVLLKGPNVFKGYHKDDGATRQALRDGWLHTGDLGRLDEDGFLYLTGRKNELIVTADGRRLSPAGLENRLRQNTWVSRAVLVGEGRPYLAALVMLDPEEAPAFAEEHGLEVETLHESEQMRDEIQRIVDAVNAEVDEAERVQRFEILPRDLSQESGELTPTQRVKRRVVNERFADVIESLYAR